MFRFLVYFFIPTVCGTSFISCSNDSSKQIPHSKEKSVSLYVKYAKNFKIILEGDEQILVLFDPTSGKVEQRFNQSELKPEKIKIVALSSTHIGMIHVLNADNLICGVSNMIYVANKVVKVNFEAGLVKEYGEENNIPLENLVSSGANLVLYSGFGKEFPHQKQLEKLGIVCLANYDWRENHPLGKAEWIKVFGFFLGKEKEANDYFDKIEKEYLNLVEEASKLKTSKSIISGNVIGDLWYAPSGDSYNSVLFRDANIKYNYSETDGTGSLAIPLEQILKENKGCAFWINPGTETFQKLRKMNSKAALFNAFKNKNVYCYSQKGNYFWEMSAVEPQKVLSDLIQITHPDFNVHNKMYFYSKLNE